MAEECAAARLVDPVVCCGDPRDCGEQACDRTWEATTKLFAFGPRQIDKAGGRQG